MKKMNIKAKVLLNLATLPKKTQQILKKFEMIVIGTVKNLEDT